MKKQASLNSRGRQAVKTIAARFGLRVSSLSTDDILEVRQTKRNMNVEDFQKALNKAGIQYKTLKHEGSLWSFQLWAKGERPTGEKMKKQKNNSKPTGSDYISRAASIAKKLRIIAQGTRPASQVSYEIFEALSIEKGQKEALDIIKRSLNKFSGEQIPKKEFMDWLNAEIERRDRTINSLNTSLDKTTKKVMEHTPTKQFEAPKID